MIRDMEVRVPEECPGCGSTKWVWIPAVADLDASQEDALLLLGSAAVRVLQDGRPRRFASVHLCRDHAEVVYASPTYGPYRREVLVEEIRPCPCACGANVVAWVPDDSKWPQMGWQMDVAKAVGYMLDRSARDNYYRRRPGYEVRGCLTGNLRLLFTELPARRG